MPTQPSPSRDGQTCLSEDVVLAFQRGETSEAERRYIHDHLDICERCRKLMAVAASLDDTTGAAIHEDSSERLSTVMAGQFPWRTFSDGKRLAGRFEIRRFVERGGMGEVYEAFDGVLRSRVALKTLLVTTVDSGEALERLGREVSLARRVAHPHVCRLYDLHEHHEAGRRPIRFLAMEFVEGETLKDRLQATGLELSEVPAVARQLVQGLAAVHAAGVLHLDFKSQNVMLRHGAQPDRAVVMDFSLSRPFEKVLRLRTSERQIAGSVGYMSPEQLECQPTIGPSADVYSFGVVLFEMLTRRLPFEGQSPASIMLKQLKYAPPAPSSVRPGVSPALDHVVLTCLRRAPRDRFQTMEDVLLALERCTDDGPGVRPRRWPRAVLASGFAASVIGALAVFGNARKPAGPVLGQYEAELQTGDSTPLAAPPPSAARPQEELAPEVPPASPAPARVESGAHAPGAVAPSSATPTAAKASNDAAGPRATKPKHGVPAGPKPSTRPAPTSEVPTEPAASTAPATGVQTKVPTERTLQTTPEQGPAAEPAPERWTPKHAPDFLL